MKKRTSASVFLLCCIAALLSCGNRTAEKQKIVNELEAEVIGIHDEVMPKMSDIERLSSALKTELRDTTYSPEVREDIRVTVALLAEGDSLMWEWMHAYKKPENVPLDTVFEYFQREKERVTKVRDVMLDGIRKGENLVKKLENEQPQ